MSRSMVLVLLLATGFVLADDTPEAKGKAGAGAAKTEKKDDTQLPGMSILGNQEAPKALVIVPWKSSELGASPGFSTMLDDSRLPIDKDVFLRALAYYEVRSKGTR